MYIRQRCVHTEGIGGAGEAQLQKEELGWNRGKNTSFREKTNVTVTNLCCLNHVQ